MIEHKVKDLQRWSPSINHAAERIQDEELSTLYGGCVLYNDPYCGRTPGRDCPKQTLCDESDDRCRFCIVRIGLGCFDKWGSTYDKDGCTSGPGSCENHPYIPGPEGPHTTGYCVYGVCIDEYTPDDEEYPNCNGILYNWCED